MQYACLVCGGGHNRVSENDILLCYMHRASDFIFRHLKTRAEFQSFKSPVCLECGKDFQRFLKDEGPMLAARFLAFIAEREVRGRKIREGIRRAKEAGKTVGRRKLRNDERIRKLREGGMSIRQISRELQIAKSTTQESLKFSGTSTTAVQRALREPLKKTEDQFCGAYNNTHKERAKLSAI